MKQTEQLEKKGYVTGSHAKIYGTAFANGTLDDEDEEEILLNAFSTGTGGLPGASTKKTTTKNKTKSNNNNSGKGNKGGGKGNKNSSSSDKDKNKHEEKANKIWKKFSDFVSGLFDWIEVRLTRLKDITEKWATAAEKAVNTNSNFQQTAYKEAINNLKKELTTNEKAKSKYEKTAVKVGKEGVKRYNEYVKEYNKGAKDKDKKKKIKKPKEWSKKILKQIQNGDLKISSYGEKKQTIIKDMQTWYDKSVANDKAIRDLTDQMQELYTSLRNLRNVKADETVDKLTKSLTHLENRAKLRQQYKYTGTGADSVNKGLADIDINLQKQLDIYNERDKAYKDIAKQNDKDYNALAKYASKKYSAIATGYKNKTKIEIKDNWPNKVKEAVAAWNASFEARKTAVENAESQLDTYLQTYYELISDKLEYITAWFGTINSLYESEISQIEALVGLGESQGLLYNSKSSVYSDQETLLQQILNNAKAETEKYQAEMKRAIENGQMTKGSKEYNEALATLRGLQTAEYNAQKGLADFKNTLNELDFTNLQNSLERIKDIISGLKSKVDYAEHIGNKTEGNRLYTLDETFYTDIINSDVKAMSEAMEAYQYALEQQKQYTVGSDLWNQWHDKVVSLREEVVGLAEDIEDNADKIRELRWKPFDEFIKQIDQVKRDLGVIQGLLNENDFISKKGLISEEGLTNIALFNELIQQSNSKIEAHRIALDKLEEELKNGNVTQDEYNEKSQEFIEIIQDEANAVADYRESILELYFESLQKQNEILEDNINLRKEALQKLKNYYDYEKQIKSSSKDISYLEQQARALEGVNLICAYSFNCWNTLRVS